MFIKRSFHQQLWIFVKLKFVIVGRSPLWSWLHLDQLWASTSPVRNQLFFKMRLFKELQLESFTESLKMQSVSVYILSLCFLHSLQNPVKHIVNYVSMCVFLKTAPQLFSTSFYCSILEKKTGKSSKC